uniref:Activin_recp domain-containing protein n=1 Tax=Strongyloides papillosus TaxID=174720 RepID=A0A0N5CEU2_STREA
MKIYNIFGVILNITFWTGVFSINCYDCNSDTGNCNEGECEGKLCVRTETASLDTNRKIVIKTCSNDDEPTECYQIPFGSQFISRCICDYPLCNGDKDSLLDMENHAILPYYFTIKIFFPFIIFILTYYISILF